MATHIHAVGHGAEKRFRLWDTTSDTYFTEPLTEAELNHAALLDITERALRSIFMNRTFKPYADSAKQFSEWEEEMVHQELPPRDPKKVEDDLRRHYGGTLDVSVTIESGGKVIITATLTPL